MSGPTCGFVTHAGCIRGCVREPFHRGKHRCIHDAAPDRRNGDEED